MSREIKFRLWCDNKKEWEKDAWHLTPDGRVIDSRRQMEMKKETHFLNQFTGLLDKNGVEIYEGDILHSGNLNYKLVWEDGKACELHNEKDRYAPRFLFHYHNDIEVIGNIYENPELLDASK